MTHVGDAFASPSLGDEGLPSAGHLLAERYRLEQHIADDSSGRQVWRGVDTILQRPVAIVLRHPGGSHAEEMLQAAVTASRVGHANMVGVYDAIDQGDYAFVVREWIDGGSLRDLILQEGPFDAERATFVLHAVSEAVAALHTSGMAHGNVHPGTVLVGDDGRVVLADARLDETTSLEADLRAIGACGYFMLTGAWPLATTHSMARGAGTGAQPLVRGGGSTGEQPLVRGGSTGEQPVLRRSTGEQSLVRGGSTGEPVLRGGTGAQPLVRSGGGTGAQPLVRGLPAARRTATGALVAPRQVRAGVPAYLDDLVMDLLSQDLVPPTAPVLAAELSRLDTGDQLLFGGAGTLRFADEAPEEPTRSPTKLVAVGSAALALVIAGMVLGIKALNANADPSNTQPPLQSSGTSSAPQANPVAIKLDKDQVRIVDPDGNRSELKNAELMIDGNTNTGWKTEGYRNKGTFGGSKSGMGILIKLDAPTRVAGVKVTLTAPGATAELRTGDKDFEDSTAGDKGLVAAYQRVGLPFVKHAGTVMLFPSDVTTQYLLIWITELPLDAATDRYRIGVQEITVEAQ